VIVKKKAVFHLIFLKKSGWGKKHTKYRAGQGNKTQDRGTADRQEAALIPDPKHFEERLFSWNPIQTYVAAFLKFLDNEGVFLLQFLV
jgi:hypothetical protein